MTMDMRVYRDHLLRLVDANCRRYLQPVGDREGAYCTWQGQRYLNLSSNDYLGLATDCDLARAFYAALDPAKISDSDLVNNFGFGSSSSRLLTGDTAAYHDLEQEIAQTYGVDREALFFSSGYHANLGLVPALVGRGDLIVADRFCHTSIVDGARISGARLIRFRHGDLSHAEEILAANRPTAGRAMLVTESVFSMDGDVADLLGFVALRERYDAFLYVDEAHAVGVRGPNGAGVCAELGLVPQVDLIVGTFGKALASQGAFAVVGPPLRDFLLNTARSLIFSTALPPVVIGWNRYVWRHMSGLKTQRAHLANLATEVRRILTESGLGSESTSNIVPIVVGGNQAALALATDLKNNGFLAHAIRPPTVPKGCSRLRLSLNSLMSLADIRPALEIIIAAHYGEQGCGR